MFLGGSRQPTPDTDRRERPRSHMSISWVVVVQRAGWQTRSRAGSRAPSLQNRKRKSQSCRRASQRLVRRRWQLLSSEQRPIRGVSATSFTASKVRSAADSPCSAGGMREASSSTRRHGWAGQSSPAVRGVLASATVDVGMVSSKASAAHQTPRPDLLYRSGGGAFKRL